MRQAYVAGKYSDTTRTREVHNISRALVAGVALTQRGLRPIVPHSSGSHHRTWEQAMGDCRTTIQGLDPVRDCLVMLPGWEESRGACEERELALRLGIPVLLLADALEIEVAHVG